MSAAWEIRHGHVVERLREMPDATVQCCITSPPYFGLRDYDIPPSTWEDGWTGCLGLEPTPEQYVTHLLEVFAEVHRVLRPEGVLWLNLGDSYTGYHGNANAGDGAAPSDKPGYRENMRASTVSGGLKPKELIGVPWRVAFALQQAGWWLRADDIWSKPNPTPESVTDRTTRSHEYLFLLSKRERYFYDEIAVREQDSGAPAGNGFAGRMDHRISGGLAAGGTQKSWMPGAGRNKRSVWTVPTRAYPDAHFAVFPERLIGPMVLAGSPPLVCEECGAPWRRVVRRYRAKGGATVKIETLGWKPTCEHGIESGNARAVVLDPFCGTGTTLQVAVENGREAVGIEVGAQYVQMARTRMAGATEPLFADPCPSRLAADAQDEWVEIPTAPGEETQATLWKMPDAA